MKKETSRTNSTRKSSTVSIKVQDYVDNFDVKLEATEDRKQPNMGNAGKSITYVKKGKNGNFRGLKSVVESLGIRNIIVNSLKVAHLRPARVLDGFFL